MSEEHDIDKTHNVPDEQKPIISEKEKNVSGKKQDSTVATKKKDDEANVKAEKEEKKEEITHETKDEEETKDNEEVKQEEEELAKDITEPPQGLSFSFMEMKESAEVIDQKGR